MYGLNVMELYVRSKCYVVLCMVLMVLRFKQFRALTICCEETLTLRFRQFRALTICCEETLTLRFKLFRALTICCEETLRVKNGQSRDTGNIGYTRHRTKTNKNRMDNLEALVTLGTQDTGQTVGSK